MQDKPLVSVIMSVYNEEGSWLKAAIDSIINNNYKNLEFIIILDNPNNISLEQIILKYKELDKRVVYIKNKENMGLVESLNMGIMMSKGEFIARMDADDISMKDRLEKQVEYMLQNTDVSLLCTEAFFIDESDNVINESVKYENSHMIKEALKYKNDLIHPTWLMRSEVIKSKDINGYRNVPYAEDYDLASRLVSHGYKISQYAEKLLKYRVRKSSITRSKYFEQVKMTSYVSYLHYHRIKNGNDKYSSDIIDRILANDDAILRYLRKRKLNKLNKGIFKLTNKHGRRVLINSIKSKIRLGV